MGHIAITCPICQGLGFNAGPQVPAPTDVVTCASCGLKLSYGFLLRKLAPASDDRKAPRKAVERKPPIKRKAHKAKRKAKRRAA